MRSCALRDAGWFPTDTITEDFGLGVHLTRHNYRCRYVEVRWAQLWLQHAHPRHCV